MILYMYLFRHLLIKSSGVAKVRLTSESYAVVGLFQQLGYSFTLVLYVLVRMVCLGSLPCLAYHVLLHLR